MKASVLLVFVMLSIGISGYIFMGNEKDDVNISRFKNNLSPVHTILKKRTRINLISNESEVQHLLEVRYVLFPIGFDLESESKHDTALVILSSDSLFKGPATLLWSIKDEKFNYYLIKKTL